MNAAALLAVDPSGLGGVVLRGPPGAARDMWLDGFRSMLPPGAPFRRVPLSISEDRLLGGLDLAATLAAGRPLAQRGVLEEADGGVILLPSAERLEVAIAARIAAVLDRGELATEREGMTFRGRARIGVVAFEERETPDEAVPAALADRLAFMLDPREMEADETFDVAAARALLPSVEIGEEAVEALCRTAAALGIGSLRAPLLAVRAARAAAALAGRTEVEADDAALAARLVLSPRATAMPAEEAEPPPPPETEEGETSPGLGEMDDLVLRAALAALPPGLLAKLAAADRRASTAGKAGALARSGKRGRPAGVRPGDPRRGERLALLDTIRAAVPFQRIRGGGQRLEVRAGDLRVVRRKPRSETTTIFLVDASGSQALGRLAEAKGAVQLLLAECYVRRDQVALIAFRGRGAEMLLAPTRSLVRAKRSLAGLPGGGGTPLASGLDAGAALADQVRRRGGTPALVVLTDGAANVGRDGVGGRAAAERDAQAAAQRIRAAGHRAILVDSSVRPVPAARRLAAELGARYVPLPFAGAAAISDAVRG
jgi:magnesium chelatase subunit D